MGVGVGVGEGGRVGGGQRGGGLISGMWGWAMTETGPGDDGRLGGDWLGRLRLRLGCVGKGVPWPGPGMKPRETVGCAARQVCVWGGCAARQVYVGGKWAGDAGVGRARTDGSGGWEGDEEWEDSPLRR